MTSKDFEVVCCCDECVDAWVCSKWWRLGRKKLSLVVRVLMDQSLPEGNSSKRCELSMMMLVALLRHLEVQMDFREGGCSQQSTARCSPLSEASCLSAERKPHRGGSMVEVQQELPGRLPWSQWPSEQDSWLNIMMLVSGLQPCKQSHLVLRLTPPL